jgi:hypothetical protein
MQDLVFVLPGIHLPRLSEKGHEHCFERGFGGVRRPKWSEEPLPDGSRAYAVLTSGTFRTVSPGTWVNRGVGY